MTEDTNQVPAPAATPAESPAVAPPPQSVEAQNIEQVDTSAATPASNPNPAVAVEVAETSPSAAAAPVTADSHSGEEKPAAPQQDAPAQEQQPAQRPAKQRRREPAHDMSLSAALSAYSDRTEVDPDLAGILCPDDECLEDVTKPVRSSELEDFFVDKSKMRFVYPTYPVKAEARSTQAWNILLYRSRKADIAIMRIELVMPKIATTEELEYIEKLLEDALANREKAYDEGIAKIKAQLAKKGCPTEDMAEVEAPHQCLMRIHQHTMLRFIKIVKKFDDYAMLLNQASFFGLIPNKVCQKILNDEEATLRRLVDKLFREQQRISDESRARRNPERSQGQNQRTAQPAAQS